MFNYSSDIRHSGLVPNSSSFTLFLSSVSACFTALGTWRSSYSTSFFFTTLPKLSSGNGWRFNYCAQTQSKPKRADSVWPWVSVRVVTPLRALVVVTKKCEVWRAAAVMSWIPLVKLNLLTYLCSGHTLFNFGASLLNTLLIKDNITISRSSLCGLDASNGTHVADNKVYCWYLPGSTVSPSADVSLSSQQGGWMSRDGKIKGQRWLLGERFLFPR